jgi:superfamily II DNA/RNA helicase
MSDDISNEYICSSMISVRNANLSSFRSILEQVRPDVQLSMWSTTFSQTLKTFSEKLMKNRTYIRLIHGECDERSHFERIVQLVDVCTEEGKKAKFGKVIQEIESARERYKLVVFVETKERVEGIIRILRRKG